LLRRRRTRATTRNDIGYVTSSTAYTSLYAESNPSQTFLASLLRNWTNYNVHLGNGFAFEGDVGADEIKESIVIMAEQIDALVFHFKSEIFKTFAKPVIQPY